MHIRGTGQYQIKSNQIVYCTIKISEYSDMAKHILTTLMRFNYMYMSINMIRVIIA